MRVRPSCAPAWRLCWASSNWSTFRSKSQTFAYTLPLASSSRAPRPTAFRCCVSARSSAFWAPRRVGPSRPGRPEFGGWAVEASPSLDPTLSFGVGEVLGCSPKWKFRALRHEGNARWHMGKDMRAGSVQYRPAKARLVVVAALCTLLICSRRRSGPRQELPLRCAPSVPDPVGQAVETNPAASRRHPPSTLGSRRPRHPARRTTSRRPRVSRSPGPPPRRRRGSCQTFFGAKAAEPADPVAPPSAPAGQGATPALDTTGAAGGTKRSVRE